MLMTQEREYVMRCVIWYHLYSFKNVKNSHRGLLFLVKLQAILKVTLLHGCFSNFLNCKNGAKPCNASLINLVPLLLL